MKHYTLEEHHTFCVESGIPGVEVWREVAKLGWLPEGIYHNPEKSFNPKHKARQKEYQKKRQSTPEFKDKQREYHLTPEFKEKQRERQSTPEYKEWRKEYRSTSEHKARRKEYEKRRNKK